MTTVDLRRTPLMRVFGGPVLQSLYATFAVLALGTAAFARHPIGNLLIGVVAVVVWLPGATAWARFDEHGVQRRCYLRHSWTWDEITAVERRTRFASGRGAFFFLAVRPTSRRYPVSLVPASGLNRAMREFTAALGAAADARGIPADLR